MKPGDIILAEFQQANGEFKKRPAVLLKKMRPYNDWLVCAVSSSLHQEVPGFDIVLDEKHPDYRKSSVRGPSLIRLGMLSTLPGSDIVGGIGLLSKPTYDHLIKNLSEYLRK